jgi:LPXTG-motif cell wall-anchored protein
MKKTVLTLSMTLLLIFSGLNVVVGQEQPKPKKDTVNMDTDAKPTFYYPTEDEKGTKGKSSVVTIGIIAGAVVVAGAAAFFFLKKKK